VIYLTLITETCFGRMYLIRKLYYVLGNLRFLKSSPFQKI